MESEPFDILNRKLDRINLSLQKVLSKPNEDLTNKRYSIDEAAKILNVVPLTIRNQIKKGNIKALRFGRKFYILHTELYKSLKEVNTSNQTEA